MGDGEINNEGRLWKDLEDDGMMCIVAERFQEMRFLLVEVRGSRDSTDSHVPYARMTVRSDS